MRFHLKTIHNLRGYNMFRLWLVSVCIVIAVVGCVEQEKRLEIPPLQEWVEGLSREIPLERRDGLSGVFGGVDTIHIVSQFTGARSKTFPEEDIPKELKTHLREYLPDLVIVEGTVETDANVLLEVNLTVRSDGSLYGFTRLEFRRDITVARTGFNHNWQVWEDIVTFYCNNDPVPDMSYNIELHSKKLGALIILAREWEADWDI